MQITVKNQPANQAAADLLAIPVFKIEGKKKLTPRSLASLDKALGGCISRVVTAGDFQGAANQTTLLYPEGSTRAARVLLIGMGDASKCDLEKIRDAAGRCAKTAKSKKARRLALLIPSLRRPKPEEVAQALAEGIVLGSYRFDEFLTGKKSKVGTTRLTLLCDKTARTAALRAAARRGVVLAESQNLARDLSNHPGNSMPPAALAKEAVRVAKEVGLRSHVMNVAELKKRKMGGVLAVGQGSSNTPRMIVLEHTPSRKGASGKRGRTPTICLIGKGITFDSGGISIKPAANMHEMKHDMSGAAAVVGAMRAVKLLDIPHHVVGVIAAAENMPGPDAYRPGDIVTTYSGKTVEILNTDAEGRIVLADALAYAAKEYAPVAMIDLATLTGACMIALGGHATGLLGNDEDLIAELREAGERSAERAWPMPLFEGHRKAMEGRVADLVNAGGREAGISTAAGFLAAFVGKIPWAHLDIAGTGWTSKSTPIQALGATGVGVRMLLDYLDHRPTS